MYTIVFLSIARLRRAIVPVRARLLRVTQKVSSNSIHTLLLADANKIGEPKLSDH